MYLQSAMNIPASPVKSDILCIIVEIRYPLELGWAEGRRGKQQIGERNTGDNKEVSPYERKMREQAGKGKVTLDLDVGRTGKGAPACPYKSTAR